MGIVMGYVVKLSGKCVYDGAHIRGIGYAD